MTEVIFDPVFVKEKKILLRRASEERARRTLAEPAARTRASRRWFLPSQNRTSIHCLGSLRTVHRRLSVCSLPVLKQSGESLGS
jgi:hypothetical protein